MIAIKVIGISIISLFLTCSIVGQISPGDLVEAHAHLEGISNCTKCHTLGAKISDDKCLACHTEIKARIDEKKGYHASSEVYKKSCITCHSDHHGRKFDIRHFDESLFDHNLAGYKLEGAHAKNECSDCHKAEFIANPDIKKKKNTFLGLNPQCLTCHTDYHQQTLPSTCENCHSQEAFKPAPNFNHDKSKFILRGQHKTVECIKCHEVVKRNGKDFQQFTGLKYKSCVNCHQDPHQNKFGQNCTDCHTEESFNAPKSISTFDHSKTDFSLVGMHSGVSCKSCHKGNLTAPLRHNRCSDCHTDYHKGQFAKNDITTDCKECHSENGFQGSSYTIERHNNSQFKLEGAHIATPCFACHKKSGEWSFRQIGIKCNDCHTDIHESFLDAKYYPESNCLKCHTMNLWSEINFDHNQTAFRLEGKHQIQTCRSCHDNKTGLEKTNLRFSGLNSECLSCHSDNHAGQFEETGKTICSNCHTSDGWKPVTFDHNRARFKLDGKHKDVACNKCHPSVDGVEKPYVLYKTGKIKCKNCH
ncbi:MAG: cytochrome C [Bacteroidales bacterium]|nr:cytochrome C [Bacteroidales bacterium]